jgi:Filamin/ABP280 repeat
MLVAGVQAQFALQTCDSEGRKRCVGGDEIDVIVTGKSPLSGTDVCDSNDGRYTVSYTAKMAGMYTVEVTRHGAFCWPCPS